MTNLFITRYDKHNQNSKAPKICRIKLSKNKYADCLKRIYRFIMHTFNKEILESNTIWKSSQPILADVVTQNEKREKLYNDLNFCVSKNRHTVITNFHFPIIVTLQLCKMLQVELHQL